MQATTSAPPTEAVAAQIELPEAVRQKAHALGTAGEAWLRELPTIVGALAIEWQLDVGARPGDYDASVMRSTAGASGEAAAEPKNRALPKL